VLSMIKKKDNGAICSIRKVEVDQSSTINEHVKYLYNNPIGSDVIFEITTVDPKECIHAHKIILARSPVFRCLFFESGMKECNSIEPKLKISIDDLSVSGFLEFMRYFYMDYIELNPTIALEVLHAAHKYQVSHLEKLCSDYLISIIDQENVYILLSQAKFFSNNVLKRACILYIERNAEKIFSNLPEGFNDLKYEDVLEIVNSDEINASELLIFKACVQWASAECMRENLDAKNPNNLRKVLGFIPYAIRFTAMTAEELAIHVVPSKIVPYEDMVHIFTYIICGHASDLRHYTLQARRGSKRKFLIVGAESLAGLTDVRENILCAAQDPMSAFHCSEIIIDLFEAHNATPSYESLKKYDAILTFSNSTYYEPEKLGNYLADFADTGNGVVVCTFSCCERNLRLEGRFLTNGYIGLKTGTSNYQSKKKKHMMVKNIPDHPIINNVPEFDAGINRGLCDLAENAHKIASWEDGVPLIVETVFSEEQNSHNIATSKTRLGKVVTINFYPVSSTKSNGGWNALSGINGNRILFNSLMYVSSSI
jgi:hypothetical protein